MEPTEESGVSNPIKASCELRQVISFDQSIGQPLSQDLLTKWTLVFLGSTPLPN